MPNVGGQRSDHNIYLLDGFKVTDELFNNLVINPSVDSIQEFKIQKSQYPAEFGGKASALINVATRAGTNVLRGSLFEFLRADRFDARNYFDPKDEPVPPLRQDQFGGALGGPIARTRTFFFVSYEGQRMRRSLTRTFSVPPAPVRTGDLSSFGSICDPATINPVTGACTPFPQSRVPADRIDPLATGFLQHVPLPTSGAALQNLTSVEGQAKDIHQVSVRVDQRLGSADQLFARFSTFDADELQPFGTSSLQETIVPGFGRDVNTTTRNLGVSHTHVFGSRVMNELRVGWMRVHGGQVSVNRGVDFAGQVGLQGVTRDPRDVGFPHISTRGLYSTMGDPTSFVYRNNEQFTGNAFADFLLGYPTNAVSGIGRGDQDGRTN